MSDVSVVRLAPRGMITIRGDFADAGVVGAVQSTLGVAVPDVRGVSQEGEGALAWMSPDELLAVMPYDMVADAVQALETALAGHHALVTNVSDARAVFRVTGAAARDVIAKGAPVDLSHDTFQPGMIRRTRLGQVAAAFWMAGEQSIDLVCFRSVSDFVQTWLETAAKGGKVGFY